MNDSLFNWMESIGFIKFYNFYKFYLMLFNTYCYIAVKDIQSKQQILEFIEQAKLRAIKYKLGEYIMNDSDLVTLRTFIEAIGYKKVSEGVWRYNISYDMPEQTYEDSVDLSEEELKAMTLNDAILRVIAVKHSKQTELEFQIKTDIETPPIQEFSIDESIKEFVKTQKPSDCPNCL